MDPAECLRQADAECYHGDIAAARRRLQDYWSWRHKSGFQPCLDGIPYGDAMARSIEFDLQEELSRRDADLAHLLGEDV